MVNIRDSLHLKVLILSKLLIEWPLAFRRLVLSLIISLLLGGILDNFASKQDVWLFKLSFTLALTRSIVWLLGFREVVWLIILCLK